MTRWSIVADLNRCVGCQTCTAACKHANATAPGVQWRKVLDVEAGAYPDVRRAFVPVGCMHCENPPCLDVCPSTATRRREDGIVTIDYDLCIGCAYCIVACPYQARSRVDLPARAYGGKAMKHEALREDPARLGVAQKCTFCVERIDFGLENGLAPGIDPQATPVCVNSCIASALHFGDAEDPNSNVSRLMQENRHFAMHEELGTRPGIFYLWDKVGAGEETAAGPQMVAEPHGMAGAGPELQTSWDWRAAANFIFGGAGSSLFIASALAAPAGAGLLVPGLLALVLVALGLFCVWREIGRPLRFINVFFHPQMSWMTRESIAALPFFGAGGLAVLTGQPWLGYAGAVFALAFLYCQARILRAAKGIPAWRQPRIVALMMATGLAEGLGLYAIYAALAGSANAVMQGVTLALMVLIALRHVAWRAYRSALGAEGAPTKTFAALDAQVLNLTLPHQLVPAALLAVGLLAPASLPLMAAAAGLAVIASGWVFKHDLITRAAWNQGYSVNRMPARGAGSSAPGIKPGWRLS
jgi:phenylacetyl-CoA:acceptor oxidoreductase subunit 1